MSYIYPIKWAPSHGENENAKAINPTGVIER